MGIRCKGRNARFGCRGGERAEGAGGKAVGWLETGMAPILA